jgi:hypothetical protein
MADENSDMAELAKALFFLNTINVGTMLHYFSSNQPKFTI